MSRPKRNLLLAALAILGIALFLWWSLRGDRTSHHLASSHAPKPSGPSHRASASHDEAEKSEAKRWPWQQDAASISGTVTTFGAGPIAGADVCAWFSHPDAPATLVREPKCTTTGADGRYVLEGLAPVNVSLNASAPEHIPRAFSEDGLGRVTLMRLRAGEARKGVDIALRDGGVRIVGVVRDLAGGVVEDALVTSETWSGRVAGSSIAHSDAEGRFAMWVAPGPISVTARADGYANSSRTGDAPGFTFELFLTPESVVVGRVVLAGTQTPVEGAIVQVGGRGWSEGSATTDAEGKFRIDRLQPGRYHPNATTDDVYGSAPKSVEVGLAQVSEEVRIEVHPIASVSAAVVVADTKGLACERGRANLTERTGKQTGRSGEIGAGGAVTIRGLQPGEYDLDIRCDGYPVRTDFAPVVVGREKIEGLTWEVKAGVSASGVVVDDTGKPVPEANVYVSAVLTGRAGTAQSTNARAATDGTFTLQGLTAGKYRLHASGEGLRSPEEAPEIEIGDGGRTDLRAVLERGGTVRGRVVDQSGTPVAGINVRVGNAWDAASTKDDGTFEAKGVEPGEQRVLAMEGFTDRLRAPGQTDDDVAGVPVQVVVGEVAEVEVVIESHHGKITGRVVDATGAPVGDAFVEQTRESDSVAAAEGRNRQQVRWGGWNEAPVLTEEDGTFTVSELAAGKHTIRAYRKGGGEALLEHVATGATNVVLTIEDTGSIAGHVTLAGGGFPEEFSVSLRDKGTGVRESDRFYRTEGAFHFEDMPAGSYDVIVTSDSGDQKASAELAAGGKVEGLEIELTARVTVRGRVVDLDTGDPVPGLRVSVSLRGQGSTFRGMGKGDSPQVTDDAGNFEVVNAPAGKVTITLFPRSFDGAEYSFFSVLANVPTDAQTHDVPDIHIPKRRVKDGDKQGDLGFKLEEAPMGVESADHPFKIAFVRPGGPAESAGLDVGAVVITVDGHDVTGESYTLGHSLMQVPEGRKLELGLEGGKSVTIVAGPQP